MLVAVPLPVEVLDPPVVTAADPPEIAVANPPVVMVADTPGITVAHPPVVMDADASSAESRTGVALVEVPIKNG